MTATVADAPARRAPRPAGRTRPVPVARVLRFELVKQFSAWRVRLLILLCWLGPGLLVFAVDQQGTLPNDTLFGRWMHATGWAGSLVVLGFAGTWVLPLLTSVVAGDVFASEDRLGTWRHLLITVRSHRRIFAAKAIASLTVILLLVAGLAVSSVVGGLLAEGNQPLVGAGRPPAQPAADAAGKVLLAWVCVLAPTLALAAIGLLGSVALGRSPMGLLLPMLAALGMQVAQMLPLPVAVRLALPGYAFISWNGLFADPQQLEPLLIGIAVSLVWAVVATALAYLLFLRRDFTNLNNDGAGRRVLTLGVLPLAGVLAVTTGAGRRHERRGRVGHRPGPRSSGRWPRRSPTSTGPAGAADAPARRSPKRSCRPPRRAPRAKGSARRRGRATTGAARSPGTSPATTSPPRPSTSSTSPRTAGTSPTATDRSR